MTRLPRAYARPVLRRLLSLVLLAAGASVTGVLAFAPPAAAEDCAWFTDQDIVNTVSDACRDTYLVDDGAGNLLSRAQLLAARGYYAAHGYSEQFLWYSREETVPVADTDHQRWTGCTSRAAR